MNVFSRIIYRIILIMVMALSIGICAGSLIEAQESVLEESLSAPIRLFLILLVIAVINGAVMVCYKWIAGCNKKQLRIWAVVLFGIMTGVFTVLFLMLEPVPFTDPLIITSKALDIIETGKIPIEGKGTGYFGRYPNNNFLTIVFVYYLRFWMNMGVKDILQPLFLLDILGIMVSTVFTWLIAIKVSGKVATGVKVLLLCTINPVYYFLAFWVYSHSLSMPFIMGVLCFGICIYQAKTVKKEVVFSVAEAIFCVIGYFIRPTSVIPWIALFSCMVLFAWKRRNRKKIVRCGLIFTVVAVLLFQGITGLNHKYFSTVEAQNFPLSHWLMMASHGEGIYNRKDVAYTARFATKEERSKATLEKTIENYKSYSPAGLVKFLYEKLVTTWSNGDSQMRGRIKQDKKMTRLYTWVAGDKSEILELYCFAFRILTMIMIIITCGSLLGNKEINKYQFLFILSLFGGILFYCFWEVKSSYSAPFIYIMLLIAEYGFSAEQVGVTELSEKFDIRKRCSVLISVFLCIVIGMVIVYQGLAEEVIKQRDYSVRWTTTSTLGSFKLETGDVITQEFYASRVFDHVVLRATKNKAETNNCSYDVELLDENGSRVFKGEINASKVENGKNYVLQTGIITPEGRQKYLLKLTMKGDGDGKIYIRYKNAAYVDGYDGICNVNGSDTPYDLFLQVYLERKQPFCSKKTAALFSGGLVAAMLLMFWILIVCKEKKPAKC